MILFVLEGQRREPRLFRAVSGLFFGGEDVILCSFGNNIYELYERMSSLGGYGDIVSVVREYASCRGEDVLPGCRRASDFSETYLFFDYDIHAADGGRRAEDEAVRRMLEYFDDETGNGKLYINYPMVEAIRYTKELPDPEYWRYAVPVSSCGMFKRLSSDFSHYRSLDFILNKKGTASDDERVRRNWAMLARQNVMKASYICGGGYSMPQSSSDITQEKIFNAEAERYVNAGGVVSVLSSLPVFLYEYFGEKIIRQA